MSELQLGLLVIGALLVAGVFAYNRYQERSAQRSAQESFRSRHADVLVEPQPSRREPAATAPKPSAPGPARGESDAGALPDPAIDYVVDLSFPGRQSAGVLVDQWKPNEHRYAGQVLLAGGSAGSWRPLHAGDPQPVEALRAGLQLVTRARTVNEAQLIEFRTAVETLAGASGASVHAPEIRQAVEAARELERFCDEADLQVVIHVIPAAEGRLSARLAHATALRSGLAQGEEGCLALRDADGAALYVLSASDGSALEAGAPETATLPGVSLTLDVPRVPDFPRVFRSMASFATELARDLGGTLADDNRQPLEEPALRAIAMQLDTVRAQFDARGIGSGSRAALRLFS